MTLCPECGKLAYWSSYFACYICEKCHYRFSGKEQDYEPLAKRIYDDLHWLIQEYACEPDRNLSGDARSLKYALLFLRNRDWDAQPFEFHNAFTRIVENAVEEVLPKRNS